ncbi:MAG: T9SS type A sorting domain-containing protein [Saprospiraceae bacterium]|nr:T9SS type A sorting domain-containing protein [Saprospiraceae bacterium]
MKIICTAIFVICSTYLSIGQLLPPKQAYPLDIKQIHSGHSLTDPLFSNWPGQYVNLIGIVNAIPSWQLFDAMVGKSTSPGSSISYRWENAPGFGAPDARHHIGNWQLLSITERVPLLYQGGSTQQWYLDGIQEQKTYLSNFVNNAWNIGNSGNGAPTLLWTTWTNIDNSDGPWRQMLDIQGAEFERMQDYANANRPVGATPVYIIPGHKMMARIYDDIQLNLVPGITNISQLFSDNIHTNSLGNYAIAMIHYSCIFNESPVGLPNDLMPDPPSGFKVPSPALALYLQTIIWDVVTNYPRTGIAKTPSSNSEVGLIQKGILIYPNPVAGILYIDKSTIADNGQTRIYNPFGQLMYSGNDLIIDVSQFPPGIYLLCSKNLTIKFVKE